MNKICVNVAPPAGAVRRLLALPAIAVVLLALPGVGNAQGIVRGAREGAHEGSHIAGPVGGVVGGAVGAGVGGAVGAVNGVLGLPNHGWHRHHHRCRHPHCR